MQKKFGRYGFGTVTTDSSPVSTLKMLTLSPLSPGVISMMKSPRSKRPSCVKSIPPKRSETISRESWLRIWRWRLCSKSASGSRVKRLLLWF